MGQITAVMVESLILGALLTGVFLRHWVAEVRDGFFGRSTPNADDSEDGGYTGAHRPEGWAHGRTRMMHTIDG